MALTEFEIKRCEKLVAEFIERRRPPPRLRKEDDLAFRINGQNVEIFAVRGRERASRLNIQLKNDLQQEQPQLEDFLVAS